MSTRTIPEIIDAFGGQAAFGRLLGVNPSTASEMKRRSLKGSGGIHPKYWPKIIAAEPVEGDRVTYEELVEAHVASAEKAEAAA